MILKHFVKEKYTHLLFEITLLIKGFGAGLEIIAGFFVLFITKDVIHSAIVFITQGEVTEDPHDFFVHYLRSLSDHFSVNSQMFVFLYLVSHGVIKLVLIISLYKKKLWAYPASLIIFGLFIVYQLYRYTFTHSLWLIVFTLLDMLVVWLVWKEYKNNLLFS